MNATTTHSTSIIRRAALAAGIVITLAACGSDAATDSAPTDAAPAEASGTALVASASSDAGQILVNADGLSVYGFTPDAGSNPTCVDGCAEAWPPVTVDGNAVPAGLDPAVFSVVEHPNGSNQLVAGEWPLYLFAGDGAPGDINGQGSGGNWFLAAPDGSLIGAAGADVEEDALDIGTLDLGY
ncbi:MAG: hypothetical protein AB8G14_03260 [Ilumatobacter sp.]